MNSTSYIVFNLLALVVGQYLVTRGRWTGFLVWSAANIYGIIICLTTGIPETSLLFSAYLVVNLYSLFSWLSDRWTQRSGKARSA